jgi:hypothetical protein
VECPAGNWVSIQLFEESNDEHDSEHAVRAIRHASEQMPACGHRIVVVKMPRRADTDDAACLFKARAAMRSQTYSNVDLVVLRCGDTGTGPALAFPGEVITPADAAFIRLLCVPMPPQRPGSAGTFLL